MNGRNWAEQYHNRGFVIREKIVEVDFEIPSQPKPRDKYVVKGSPKANRPGTWDSTMVEVFRRTHPAIGFEKVCEYERYYSLLRTFEPFRQGEKEFALVSRDYTKTEVLDLATGNIIAAGGDGFCPVGFYVPDWWDVNDGSSIPGSNYWSAEKEWPRGDFGFVWGCIWGDDSSWKVQFLDLSKVQQGVLQCQERFGYLELATFGYDNPCFRSEPAPIQKSAPPPFIQVTKYGGDAQVTFAVEMTFGLDSGQSDWQRLKIGKFE
jgi:hypothetical protein